MITLEVVTRTLKRRPHEINREGVRSWQFDIVEGDSHVRVSEYASDPRFAVEIWNGAEFVSRCPASDIPSAAALVISLIEGS